MGCSSWFLKTENEVNVLGACCSAIAVMDGVIMVLLAGTEKNKIIFRHYQNHNPQLDFPYLLKHRKRYNLALYRPY